MILIIAINGDTRHNREMPIYWLLKIFSKTAIIMTNFPLVTALTGEVTGRFQHVGKSYRNN